MPIAEFVDSVETVAQSLEQITIWASFLNQQLKFLLELLQVYYQIALSSLIFVPHFQIFKLVGKMCKNLQESSSVPFL